MKKRLIVFFIFSLTSIIGYGSYSRTFLPKLIENAKVIVYGQIISVDKTTFKVVTIKKIKSTSSSDTLTIKKFKNWECAFRYSTYEIGQKALFFLVTNKNDELQTMGIGNEGEMIVRSDSAFIEDYGQKIFEVKKYNFISRYTPFICLNVETVIKGIKIYLENAELINKELNRDSPGTIAYQYSTIEKLQKNDFLSVVIDQKQRGH